MRIILNRDDIEEAIHAYVKDKFFPYGDDRELNIVQGTKATATITIKQDEQLPGLTDEEFEEQINAEREMDKTAGLQTEPIDVPETQETEPTIEDPLGINS